MILRKKEKMKTRLLIIGLFVAGFVFPAMAQEPEENELLPGCYEDIYGNIYCGPIKEDALTLERFLFDDFYFAHDVKPPVPFGLTLTLSVAVIVLIIIVIKKRK